MIKRKTTTLLIVLVALVVAGTTFSSSAMAAGGACGGGSTFNQMYKGWQKKGVLKSVYRSAGIKPGVDAKRGAASKALLKKAFTKKRVIRGTSRAKNTTCKGGRFVGLSSRARQSSGTYVWVLKDDVRKDGTVKKWWAADCGNRRSGKIRVNTPKKKAPPKKAKPKPPTKPQIYCANTGQMVNSISQCVVQTNTSNQECGNGQVMSSTGCVAIQINNNCGNTVVGGGEATGNNCNVTNICSNVNSPGGVVICATPPTPNGGPQITCVFPAHLYSTQGSRYDIYCEGYDPDGDRVTITFTSTGAGHISGAIGNTTRYDGSTCPADVACYRVTFWGSSLGMANVTATATSLGGEAHAVGQFPVYEDEF